MPLSLELLDYQLGLLQEERKTYVARLRDILDNPDRNIEVLAYLKMIEAVNDAAIRLARQFQPL